MENNDGFLNESEMKAAKENISIWDNGFKWGGAIGVVLGSVATALIMLQFIPGN